MIIGWQDMQSIEYSDDYHCEHFAADVHLFLTSIDISDYLLSGRFALPINLRNFNKIDTPSQHCIVLMRDKAKAHIGIWYDNAVLHLGARGVVHQTLDAACLGFNRVSFYEVKTCK